MAHKHDHSHTHADKHLRELKLYLIAFGLSLFAGVFEIFVSFCVSDSVALFSDATHGIFDGLTYAGLALVIFASIWRPGKELAFTKVGIWLSFILLLMGDILVFHETILRIFNPREILGWTTFFTAGLSFVINGIVVRMMSKIPKEEHNIRHDSMSFHAMSDFIVSIGVICSAAAIAIYKWYALDWVISLVVAFYLLFLLWKQAMRIYRGEWHIGHEHAH